MFSKTIEIETRQEFSCLFVTRTDSVYLGPVLLRAYSSLAPYRLIRHSLEASHAAEGNSWGFGGYRQPVEVCGSPSKGRGELSRAFPGEVPQRQAWLGRALGRW